MDNSKSLNEILLDINDILDRIGIEFFLQEGTLLGLIRDKKLIYWDNDIDIGSFADASDVGLIEKIEKEFQAKGWSIQRRGPFDKWGVHSYHFSIIPPKKGGLSVGFAFYKEINGKAVPSSGPGSKSFSMSLFRDMKTISFLNKKFKVPNPPEEYLRLNYGETWKTPGRNIYIIRDSSPIKLYKNQKMGYRADEAIDVYLECDLKGNFIEPLTIIGKTVRQRYLEGKD